MVDLGRIQQRLNTEARYRDDFLKDPVGVLLREGLALPLDAQNKLRLQVAQLIQKQTPVRGAAIPGRMEVLLSFSW